jgi:ribosomal protein S18 acetylase RimI-like enzyme
VRDFNRFTVPLVVEIRPCTARDLEPLEWFGLFTAQREIIREAFAAQERGDGLMLLADVHGFPAGQVWIDLERKRTRRTGVLWAVRVYPFLQTVGIGTRLVEAAEHALRERGWTWSELGVERTNLEARGFYERMGYRAVGEERGSFGYTAPGSDQRVEVARDEVILRKPLAGARRARGGAAIRR